MHTSKSYLGRTVSCEGTKVLWFSCCQTLLQIPFASEPAPNHKSRTTSFRTARPARPRRGPGHRNNMLCWVRKLSRKEQRTCSINRPERFPALGCWASELQLHATKSSTWIYCIWTISVNWIPFARSNFVSMFPMLAYSLCFVFFL